MNKYNASKTAVGGITFDSRKEAERYIVLKSMEENGIISDLRLQVRYELVPKQKIGNETFRKVEYIADFVYRRDGVEVVEDVKGYRNPASAAYAKYVLKKKLMAWIHGIVITEV